MRQGSCQRQLRLFSAAAIFLYFYQLTIYHRLYVEQDRSFRIAVALYKYQVNVVFGSKNICSGLQLDGMNLPVSSRGFLF